MSKYFDEGIWDTCISKFDWYLKLASEFELLEKLKQNLSEQEIEVLKEDIYSYIEGKLENEIIPINVNGPNWDAERKTIDTIIIHHTSHDKPLTLTRLNTMHLLRLYMPFFKNPSEENKFIKGRAISSGHYMQKKQVFYGYHWLVRLDGSIERLLKDEYIGWHAGNWDINTRSIAICIDGNFEKGSPKVKVIQSIANLINENYPKVETEKILGHREITKKTVCPGKEFLSVWKPILINLIKMKHLTI